MFQVTVLGSSAAMPAFGRHLSSQVVEFPHIKFMIDCGEGTQIQAQKYKIKLNKINHIFISHLHGDHYLGLVGLLSSMHLQRRQQAVYLYGHRDLMDIVRIQLKVSTTVLRYPLHFVEVTGDAEQLLYEDEQIIVTTFPLKHRILCTGFLFKEKPKKRKVIKDKMPEGISVEDIITLKEGQSVLDRTGKIKYDYQELTIKTERYSYAYCSDTKYDENLLNYIEKVDLLYHESTFLQEEADKAAETFHSTAKQAATIAKKANVKNLLLGHFSPRYKNLTPFLKEAKSIFEQVYVAKEGEALIIESSKPVEVQ